jgi:hypothetical protein
MSLETVFLLAGWGMLGAILVTAVCTSGRPEADRSAREWINTALSVLTVVVLAWTASSIVDQVTEMRKVYPEIQEQAQAAADQTKSFVSSERARMFIFHTDVERNGDKDPNPRFRYQLANMGRTAALLRGVLAQCEVSAASSVRLPSHYENRFKSVELIIVAGTALQNPGFECTLSKSLTEDDFAGLRAKTKVILLTGYFIFQDVFGQTWKKNFGMYGLGDEKFFNENLPDAFNAEEEVKTAGTVPISTRQ